MLYGNWLTKPNRAEAGFFDASIWETAKRTSPLALKRLISELKNTSVTVVLIGSNRHKMGTMKLSEHQGNLSSIKGIHNKIELG